MCYLWIPTVVKVVALLNNFREFIEKCGKIVHDSEIISLSL